MRGTKTVNSVDSIVNRLAHHAREIKLGSVDMRKTRDEEARASDGHWE